MLSKGILHIRAHVTFNIISRNDYLDNCCFCREDCMAIKDMFCLKEWVSIMDKKQDKQFLASWGHFRLPNCSQLPSVNHVTPPPCSPADLFDIESANYTCTCNLAYMYSVRSTRIVGTFYSDKFTI